VVSSPAVGPDVVTVAVVLVDVVTLIVVVVAVDVISKHVGNEPLNVPDDKHV